MHCKSQLFTQVCSTSTGVDSSNAQGKSPCPLLNAVHQTKLTACLCHCGSAVNTCCSYSCALLRYQCTVAMLRQNVFTTAQCLSPHDRSLCHCQCTVDVSSSHKCAALQQERTGAMLRVDCTHVATSVGTSWVQSLQDARPNTTFSCSLLACTRLHTVIEASPAAMQRLTQSQQRP